MNWQTEQLRIAAELHKRDLYRFTKSAWQQIESAWFVDNWHIRAVCEHLQAVWKGEIENLIINIPPGCSKSLLACVFFPAWGWANDPTKRWFFASYDQRLSTRDSVRCRALLESKWYQDHFPNVVKFTADQNQKTYYENTATGYRMASSVGGHGTGTHPDIIVCDDPNNARQAESEVERQTVADWWTLTMSTRGVSRKARRVIIQQRLHEEDLTGVCLRDGSYVHLCLPMRYEGSKAVTFIGFVDPREQEGQLLSPQQFDEETVQKLERALGAYGTAGQLQQRPAPKTAGFFKTEECEIVDAAPVEVLARVRGWDTASTAAGGDYTVGVRISKDKNGIYYVEDVIRGQYSPEQRPKIQRHTADLDYAYPICNSVPQVQGEEPGSAGKDQAAAFKKLMAGYPCETERQTGAKDVRAYAYASQMNAGNVKIVRATWNRDFLEEHKMFPVGKHDDQVDAVATAFNYIENKGKVSFLPTGWDF